MEALVFSLSPTANTRRALSTLASFTALATIALGGPTASADAALISTAACNSATLSQPFRNWGDSSLYELLPGGDFESASTGWTLSAHAQRVRGSEPFAATGSTGAYSLSLAAGDTAQSPFTCVNAAYPTFRLFARNEGLAATVLVQVVYRTALGSVALPLGTVALSGDWHPTLPMLTGSVVVGLLSGGTAQAALRFTALTGTSRIDDVFVDPRMR
jgi:hypothetical protein